MAVIFVLEGMLSDTIVISGAKSPPGLTEILLGAGRRGFIADTAIKLEIEEKCL